MEEKTNDKEAFKKERDNIMMSCIRCGEIFKEESLRDVEDSLDETIICDNCKMHKT